MKKKIIIVIVSLTIFLIFMFSLFTFIKKSNNIQVENLINTDNVEKNFNTEEVENFENVNDVEKQNMVTEEIVATEEYNIVNEIQTVTNKENVKNQEEKYNATNNKISKAETTTSSIINQPNVEHQNEIINKQETKEPIIKQEEKPIEETQIVKNEEKFVINNNMINNITNIINSNISDSMQNYGYEIKVDSSIVELTSQFTYTDTRVKNKIANKFGTIRIYARNYYKNGTLMWTECFIL